MEEHPVPHNVLDIEFKLFGAFSVRQFAKILLGGALALGVYVLNLPQVISIPLIVASLGYGVASALIKNFNSLANTIISAILVSPRYVWQKSAKAPEFMTRDYQSKVVESQQQKQTDVGVNDADLDAILQMRSGRRQQSEAQQQPQQQTLSGDVAPDLTDRPLPEIYAEEWNSNQTPINSVQTAEQTYQQVDVVTNTQPRGFVGTAPNPDPVSPEATGLPELADQLTSLRGQLNQLQKSGASAEEIAAVQQQIDTIYSRTQEMQDANTLTPLATLAGSVIDKRERPLAGVEVKVVGKADQQVIATTSTDDNGQFLFASQLPYGEYMIELSKPGKRFDRYGIIVNTEKPPRYKFRSK